MREIPLTNCAKEFIQAAAAQKQRLDGREQYGYRKVKIAYGLDRGCCHVHIGDTRVLAQVSSEVAEPKLHRPTDGVLYVNVEMSPMTSPSVEFGRPSDHCIEIQRILERTLKESRCLDLESLCIVSSKQVWQLRVDVHCLNNAGNLLDACSIAGIAALAHFRLPDVTIDGDEVTIHSLTERDPIPLSLHHMPICCTFAFFSQGKLAFVDPCREEERVMEGKLVVGMNKHRELCCLQSAGSMLLMREQVMRCSNIAVEKVGRMTEIIQSALENDSKARASGDKCGFAESTADASSSSGGSGGTGPGPNQDSERLKDIIRNNAENGGSSSEEEMIAEDTPDSEGDKNVKKAGKIGEGGPASWWDVDDEEMLDVVKAADKANSAAAVQRKRAELNVAVMKMDSDEEEETMTLNPEQFTIKVSKSGNVKQGKKKRKS